LKRHRQRNPIPDSDIINFLLELVPNVEIHLASERIDPEHGDERTFRASAETHVQAQGPIIIYFGHEILEPSLDKNITMAERMLGDFRVASTLMHELTVR
jgi:hypothetical protein